MQSALRSTWCVGSPMSVRPVPGFSWWPVIAVILLSRMFMTIGALLTIASMRPVMPEWKKVESPMTAKTFSLRPARSTALRKPTPPETLAPMQMTLSVTESGGTMPSV